MKNRELRELRRWLDTIPRGRGHRIPRRLRERVTAWVALHRECGAWWSELAAQIGVPAKTLKRWSAPSSSRPIALRRVEVAEVAEPARTITLVAPTGVRIEGVTVADAIAILRGLS